MGTACRGRRRTVCRLASTCRTPLGLEGRLVRSFGAIWLRCAWLGLFRTVPRVRVPFGVFLLLLLRASRVVWLVCESRRRCVVGLPTSDADALPQEKSSPSVAFPPLAMTLVFSPPWLGEFVLSQTMFLVCRLPVSVFGLVF